MSSIDNVNVSNPGRRVSELEDANGVLDSSGRPASLGHGRKAAASGAGAASAIVATQLLYPSPTWSGMGPGGAVVPEMVTKLISGRDGALGAANLSRAMGEMTSALSRLDDNDEASNSAAIAAPQTVRNAAGTATNVMDTMGATNSVNVAPQSSTSQQAGFSFVNILIIMMQTGFAARDNARQQGIETGNLKSQLSLDAASAIHKSGAEAFTAAIANAAGSLVGAAAQGVMAGGGLYKSISGLNDEVTASKIGNSPAENAVIPGADGVEGAAGGEAGVAEQQAASGQKAAAAGEHDQQQAAREVSNSEAGAVPADAPEEELNTHGAARKSAAERDIAVEERKESVALRNVDAPEEKENIDPRSVNAAPSSAAQTAERIWETEEAPSSSAAPVVNAAADTAVLSAAPEADDGAGVPPGSAVAAAEEEANALPARPDGGAEASDRNQAVKPGDDANAAAPGKVPEEGKDPAEKAAAAKPAARKLTLEEVAERDALRLSATRSQTYGKSLTELGAAAGSLMTGTGAAVGAVYTRNAKSEDGYQATYDANAAAASSQMDSANTDRDNASQMITAILQEISTYNEGQSNSLSAIVRG